MSVDRLFVYGTLRPGASAFELVADRVEAHLPAVLVDHVLYGEGHRYPWCVEAPGGEVAGDLLWLRQPDQTLALVDEYEGIDGLDAEYRRVIAQVLTEEGPTTAWVYVGSDIVPPGAGRIRGDDWVADD